MNNIEFLQEKAREIRKLTIKSIYTAQSGHPGGALSSADILSVLYFEIMDITPERIDDPKRDRFILSKGHSAPAYYAALALKGYFPVEDLESLRKGKDCLQGHPSMHITKGIDYSSGSLGQGLSIANGMAIYSKRNKIDNHIYCLCGDGELQEGQIWEAAMFSAHYGLNNLTLIIDNNGLQIDGKVEDVMNNAPLDKKFRAFGWNVIGIDGHDIESISNALNASKNSTDKPTCIIAKTIKGKGVSFMENQAGWHGAAPNTEQFEIAMKELGE